MTIKHMAQSVTTERLRDIARIVIVAYMAESEITARLYANMSENERAVFTRKRVYKKLGL